MDIHKGDGVITISGARGIVTHGAWTMGEYMTTYKVVRVKFDEIEMPIQVTSIVQIWRGGVRVDNVERVEQLELL